MPCRWSRQLSAAPRSAGGRSTSALRLRLKAAPETTGLAGTTRTDQSSAAARASCFGVRCAPERLLLSPCTGVADTAPGAAQAEACDQLSGFLLLQSVAGGTGAGLGAYLVEALRCASPKPPCARLCGTSHASQGRVPRRVRAQPVCVAVRVGRSHRAKLQHAADACHAARCGGRHHRCPERGASCSRKQTVERREARLRLSCAAISSPLTRVRCFARPSLDDLNGLAARALATALLPARWRPVEASRGGVRGPASLFVDTAARLCAHPSQRLLTLLSVPQMPARSVDFTTFTWPALLKRLRQMLITGASRAFTLRVSCVSH